MLSLGGRDLPREFARELARLRGVSLAHIQILLRCKRGHTQAGSSSRPTLTMSWYDNEIEDSRHSSIYHHLL